MHGTEVNAVNRSAENCSTSLIVCICNETIFPYLFYVYFGRIVCSFFACILKIAAAFAQCNWINLSIYPWQEKQKLLNISFQFL